MRQKWKGMMTNHRLAFYCDSCYSETDLDLTLWSMPARLGAMKGTSQSLNIWFLPRKLVTVTIEKLGKIMPQAWKGICFSNIGIILDLQLYLTIGF